MAEAVRASWVRIGGTSWWLCGHVSYVACTLGTQVPPGASVQVVQAGQKPPPLSVGRSCVYVCVRGDGFVYCGQTDDIRSELLRW